MLFFQEIFKNADPDKRRAMIKSFQTSSGTVLSTDWGDVSQKDYEGKDRPSPPKGQEWKEREI
jgi:suppressor of G2 allele of SKP1